MHVIACAKAACEWELYCGIRITWTHTTKASQYKHMYTYQIYDYAAARNDLGSAVAAPEKKQKRSQQCST